jgi:hypothetical protein
VAQLFSLGDLRIMKRTTWVLLLALIALPVYSDSHLIYDAITILRSQGAARAQGDFGFYMRLPIYGTSAAVLSLLGLHFCSLLGVRGRHPLHIAFVVTTLVTFVVFFVFQFLWDRT